VVVNSDLQAGEATQELRRNEDQHRWWYRHNAVRSPSSRGERVGERTGSTASVGSPVKH
jgi:hypothetical protein